MALRNQPYLPLYVDDFANDENLKECSASSTGVYIRCMALMHKNLEYGKILLEQKYQQDYQQVVEQYPENSPEFVAYLVACFATKLARHFPYDFEEIRLGLTELLENSVLILDGCALVQKRMVKDAHISDMRSISGSSSAKGKGGANNFKRKKKAKTTKENFVPTKVPTTASANTVNEIVIVNGINSIEKEELSNNMEGGAGGISELTQKPKGNSGTVGDAISKKEDYDGKFHLFATPEVCCWFYFNHPIAAKAKEDTSKLILTWIGIDKISELDERMLGWANRYNAMLHQKYPGGKQMQAQESTYQSHFHNWLATQKEKLKTKPWETEQKNRDVPQYKNMADILKERGLQ